eukprot:PITA_12120
MDVKTAFLKEVIDEEVYVEQPQGFHVLGQETHVCWLRRALYGLNQALRAWYSKIDTYLQQMGFMKSDADPNLYYIVVGDDPLVNGCKEDLSIEFEMKDIGLMRYFLGLEAIVDYGLHYRQGDGVRLAGYIDADWAGCASDTKSTSRCFFRLALAVVLWFSRKKKSVSLSSSEAKYMAANQASCEAIWLRKLLYGLFDQELRPTVIHCDNQSCIKVMENPMFHGRPKHIDIRYHFIRDYV